MSTICFLLFRLAKDETNWKNKQDLLNTEQSGLANLQGQLAELNQEELSKHVEAATAARDEAAAALQAAEHGVEAATRELAGELSALAQQCSTRQVLLAVCLVYADSV